jgi:hypothetical protein
MARSTLAEVAYQIEKFWAPQFTKELRGSLLLGGLVNKDYSGQISKGGDEVTVSQINSPAGQLLTIGTDADSFDSEAISTSYVKVKADKRAVASYEFDDVVSLQSMIDAESSEVSDALKYSVGKQINDYLYSLVNPSSASPDHLVSGVTDFNTSQLAATRLLAATAKWGKSKPWYLALSPTYYSDLLDETQIVETTSGATDVPMINGVFALKRMGFNVFEDDSRGTDYGLAFHPDFMHLVMQPNVQVKVSDLHSQKRFVVVMSVDIIFGAKLGINGNVKHIKIYNS